MLAIGWLVVQGFSNPTSRSSTLKTQTAGGNGAQAPSMSLVATTGGQVSLDEYRGSKVVVYFYEGAG